MLALLLLSPLALGPQGPVGDPGGKQLVLNAPILRSDEGILLGSGLLGAVLWGEGHVLRISLDRSDLWDTRPAEPAQDAQWNWSTVKRLSAENDSKGLTQLLAAAAPPRESATKLPPGCLELTFPNSSCRIERFRLDLRRAEATVELTGAVVKVHAPLGGKVVRIRIEGQVPELALVAAKGLATLSYRQQTVLGGDRGRGLVLASPRSGSHAFGVLARSTESGCELVATVLTSDEAPNLEHGLEHALATAARTAYAAAFEKHKERWAQQWAACSVHIPDAKLMPLYDLGRYLYCAGSQPGGVLMGPQGPWTTDTDALPSRWGSYRHDRDTWEIHLACHALGAEGTGQPLIDWLTQLAPTFRHFAKEFYGVEGLLVPARTGLDGAPLGRRAEYGLSPASSIWLVHALWLRWRFTLQRGFLEQVAYPWCKEVGSAQVQLLDVAEGGALRLPYPKPVPSRDQALLRWLFGALATMARELGEAKDMRHWQSVLERLEPLARDPKTSVLGTAGAGLDLDLAAAIHPLGLVDCESSAEQRKTALATLASLGQQAAGSWSGAEFARYAALAARVGMGDLALESLHKLERAFVGRNGLNLTGDQTGTGLSRRSEREVSLGGNFLVLNAVHEMLVRGQHGAITVFPAVPQSWRDVSFEGLRVEGAMRVSARREQGKTVWVRVVAQEGGVLRLFDPFRGAAVTWSDGGSAVNPKRVGAGYEADLAAGQEVEARLR